MILFYSVQCPYSRSIYDEIKRRDTSGIVKCVSIDSLITLGKPIPSEIHSVPALLTLPNKKVIFGKAVFDTLFLPNTGLLTKRSVDSPNVLTKKENEKIEPFSIITSNGFSDSFASLSETTLNGDSNSSKLDDRGYKWSNVGTEDINNITLDIKSEPNVKREMIPDIAELRKMRDNDISNSRK